MVLNFTSFWDITERKEKFFNMFQSRKHTQTSRNGKSCNEFQKLAQSKNALHISFMIIIKYLKCKQSQGKVAKFFASY